MRRLLPAALALLTLLPAAPGTSATPPVDPPLKIFFTDPTRTKGPLQTCETDSCTSLLHAIQGAEKTIDFAIYGIRGQPDLLDALLGAMHRGVRIRGIVDKDLDNVSYYSGTEDLIKALGTVRTDYEADRRKASKARNKFQSEFRCDPIPGFDGPPQCIGYDLGDRCIVGVHASREGLSFKGDIMHDKMFVIDGHWVWTGSTNVSDAGTGGYNANLVTVIDSAEVASWYTAEIDQMWVDDKFHEEKSRAPYPLTARLDDDIAVDVYFSPQDDPMEKAVRPLLQDARESIDVAVFFLTHKRIAADLIDAHRRGVKVRVLLDATSATNGYTKHEVLRLGGIPVKVENWGGKMHMKSAVIDGEHTITGSMNWTSAGEGTNDENTVIVHSRSIAAQFTKNFEKLWKSVDDRWLVGRPDPESRDSGTACTDGSDNDFDRLKDDADPGCGKNPPPLSPLPPLQIVPKEAGHGLIKGVVTYDGRKLSYGPKHHDYDEMLAEQWFCSENDAWEAGYKRAY